MLHEQWLIPQELKLNEELIKISVLFTKQFRNSTHRNTNIFLDI